MLARLTLLSSLALSAGSCCIADSALHFDLPATAPAVDVTPADWSSNDRLMSIQFNLSLIADSLPAPRTQQLVVQVIPLGGDAIVADYEPRTELSSGVVGNIEVSKSREHQDHIGVSLDAAYSHMTRGNIGADSGEKNTHSAKYSRIAPVHVVAASGTTHRGRGVYFKLCSDESQVLEGDKQFTVILRVPAHWRGELIEFRAEASAVSMSFSSSLTSFAGIAPKAQVVGVSRFIVATHLAGDDAIEQLARQMGEAELQMRETAADEIRQSKKTSRLSYTSFRFDLSGPDPAAQYASVANALERVIFEKADPYTDEMIKVFSIDTRVAILDYLDARRTYLLCCQ